MTTKKSFPYLLCFAGICFPQQVWGRGVWWCLGFVFWGFFAFIKSCRSLAPTSVRVLGYPAQATVPVCPVVRQVTAPAPTAQHNHHRPKPHRAGMKARGSPLLLLPWLRSMPHSLFSPLSLGAKSQPSTLAGGTVRKDGQMVAYKQLLPYINLKTVILRSSVLF